VPGFSFADTPSVGDDGVEDVLLTEGSILYHPPGIWHQVECTEDSVSINISLVGATYADVLADGVRHLLWKDDFWRQTVSLRGVAGEKQTPPPVAAVADSGAVSGDDPLANVRAALRKRLADFQREVASLSVDDLLPPAVVYPRPSRVIDVRKREANAEGSMKMVRFNPLAQLMRADAITHNRNGQAAANKEGDDEDSDEDSDGDDDDEDGDGDKNKSDDSAWKKEAVEYVCIVGFGNEEMNNVVRTRLRVEKELVRHMDAWIEQRAGEPTHLVVPHSLFDETVTAALRHVGFVTNFKEDCQSE
jgi:hypothetical protein